VGFVLGALYLFLVIAALIDVITRDESLVRHLPKLTWVLVIVFLPLIGSIVWFAVGHDWGSRPEPMPFGDPRRHEAAAQRLRAPDYEVDDAAIEAELRLSEKQARIRRLEAEVEARRRANGAAPDQSS